MRGKGLFLPIAFLVAFSLPVLLLALYGRIGAGTLDAQQDIFPQALSVSEDGVYVRVAESALLDPVEDKDMLFFLWFKLKRLPEAGQKMTLLNKIDDGHRVKPGYAIVISGEKGGARFQVYWKNGSGRGGWFSFSDTPLRIGVWTMVAVSFSGGRFLGVHTATREAERLSEQLAGGHDLGEIITASSKADLVIGAPRGNQFRGALGPFGLFIGKKLSDRFKEILKALARSPLSMPPLHADNQARLFVLDSATDQSGNNLTIEVQNGARQKRERRGFDSSK